MPRAARGTEGGICYHVLNRGNGRATVFHGDEDYQDFMKLMDQACIYVRMRVLGFCLMPNHFHMALWPYGDDDLGRWMQWLMTSQVRRYHSRHDTAGHVWQGRYKGFPVQNDRHLATVLRYVERNPLRAGLVSDPAAWPWSSHATWRSGRGPTCLHPTAAVLNPDWPEVVREPQTEAELLALRECLMRGRPYGEERWVGQTVDRLGLEFTLLPLGRPIGKT